MIDLYIRESISINVSLPGHKINSVYDEFLRLDLITTNPDAD